MHRWCPCRNIYSLHVDAQLVAVECKIVILNKLWHYGRKWAIWLHSATCRKCNILELRLIISRCPEFQRQYAAVVFNGVWGRSRMHVLAKVKPVFKDLLTPFWLFSAMPALMTTTNINSIVLGEWNSQITSFWQSTTKFANHSKILWRFSSCWLMTKRVWAD